MHPFFEKMGRERRLKKIEEGLPECFCMMANAMKAGLSLSQGLKLVAFEGPTPIREEMMEVWEKMRRGHSLEEALLSQETKLNLPNFSLMVHSILTLKNIGGNLVAHFENLVRILRERQRVSGKIRLLTTQGMTQGAILGLLPCFLGGALYFLSPDFISPLFETTLGWMLMTLILLLDLGGWLWMQKLARVKI